MSRVLCVVYRARNHTHAYGRAAAIEIESLIFEEFNTHTHTYAQGAKREFRERERGKTHERKIDVNMESLNGKAFAHNTRHITQH